MPDSMSTIRLWHNPDKINPHQIRIDFLFIHIHKCCSFECSTLHHAERIKRMSMTFIPPIPNFYKYKKIPVTSNDIDLTSFDLIIAFEDDISFAFQIFDGKFFSLISDASFGWFFGFSHREEWSDPENKYILLLLDCFVPRNDRNIQNIFKTPKTHLLFFWEILLPVPRDHREP